MAETSQKFTLIFGVNSQAALAGLRRFSTQASLAMAAIGASLVAATKSAINAADEIGKTAQKIGISVRELSGLVYAGKLADATLDDLSTAFKGLNKAITSNSEALQRLGIERLNADGSLRSSQEILLDIADAFEAAKDGAGKSALAVELFGKAGANLIPLLNQGRKGIQDQIKEGEKLGVVFGETLAKQAEEFNDNLTRMKTNLQGVGFTIANDLLPALNRLFDKMSEFKDRYGDQIVGAVDSTLALLGIGRGPSASAAVERSGFVTKPKGRIPVGEAEPKQEIAQILSQKELIKEQLKLLEMQWNIDRSKPWMTESKMREKEIRYLEKKNELLGQLKDSYGQPPLGGFPFSEGVQEMSAEAQMFNADVVPIAEQIGVGNARLSQLKNRSFGVQFREGMEAVGDAATDINARGAETAIGAITTGVEGLGDAITGVITGAKNWAQVWQGVATQIISMVVQMIIKFTVLKGLMSIFGLGSGGGGGFLQGIFPGRATGGTMLPGGLYQVGEKGTEYAVTSRTLSRLGTGYFQALDAGMKPSGGGSGVGSGSIIIVDSRQKANTLNESMGLRATIREVMSDMLPAT